MAEANDVEDFVTCGVCFYEFDDDVERKPKFLPCSHTVCLSCLKAICKGHLITCPFCREMILSVDVASLPNNPYALHMLKFKDKKAPNSVVTLSEIHWCLTCGSAEKSGCSSSGHSSVNMTANAIKNMEVLFNLKEELLKMKDTGTNQLAMAIQERRKVQEQLALIMKSVQCSIEEVQKLQDENNLRLTEWISILERSESNAGGAHNVPAKKILFFSELMAIVEGSTVEDTPAILKQKMGKSVELYEKYLFEATAIGSEYDFRKKVKISIHLYNENDRRIPTAPWLEEGFRFLPLSSALKGSQIRQDSLLVSHAVFSLLQRQKISLDLQPTASAVISPLLNPAEDCSSSKIITMEPPKRTSVASKLLSSFSLPPTVLSNNTKFVLGQSTVFILRLFQSASLKGEFFIRPVPTFHLDFVQKLGEFCYKSPKVFCNSIDHQSSSGVYVLFPMAHLQFQPVVSNMMDIGDQKSQHYNPVAEQVDEVGITNLINDGKNAVTGWSFIFPMEHFRDPKYKVQVNNLCSNELFGRIIQRSRLELAQACVNYIITLESQ